MERLIKKIIMIAFTFLTINKIWKLIYLLKFYFSISFFGVY